MQHLIVLSWGKRYLTLMVEFDGTNGLLWGRNNWSHLGSATFPAVPNMQTHTLCFNKSLQHHRQHSTRLYSVCACVCVKAASEVLPLRFMSLCNTPLCQDTHYANALFTVHVTISRHESQWGPGAVASYQERWRREKEQTQKELPKECGKWLDCLTLSQSFYNSELAEGCKKIKVDHSEKGGF